VGAKNWLQASNPSERWKWDVMFQDLAPVKFDAPPDLTTIPFTAIRFAESRLNRRRREERVAQAFRPAPRQT
jgi:hypothetical protein